MTDTYEDLLIRRAMSDENGAIPFTPASGENMWHSPDIIPMGVNVDPNVAKYLKDNWTKDVGQDVSIGKPNYIYVRGKNLFAGSATGKVHLYFCPASLLLYTDQWIENELASAMVDPQHPQFFVNVNAGKKNDIFVGDSPFLWIPKKPDVNDHYCLIARVETEKHPHLVPNVGDIDDLSKFLLNNPGWAQRNVTYVDASSPTINKSMIFNQGPIGGDMFVLLTVTNAPEGTEIEASCPGSGPSQPIYIPKQEIKYATTPSPTNDKTFVTGIRTTIPANFKSVFTYTYYSHGKQPLKGFKICVDLFYAVPKTHELYNRFYHPSKYGISGEHIKDIEPSNLLRLGSCTTEDINQLSQRLSEK